MLLGEHAMDIASVFDWFAQESGRDFSGPL
jgi:hypothetical protein